MNEFLLHCRFLTFFCMLKKIFACTPLKSVNGCIMHVVASVSPTGARNQTRQKHWLLKGIVNSNAPQ